MTRRGATRGNGRVINPEGDKRISPLKFVYAGQAQALRKEGLTYDQIGQRLGISGSYAQRLCNPEK
jgi:hypothetical protein